jgi:hypothetical protein
VPKQVTRAPHVLIDDGSGISFITEDLGAKQLGLLRELRPEAARIAVLESRSPPTIGTVVVAALAASAEGVLQRSGLPVGEEGPQPKRQPVSLILSARLWAFFESTLSITTFWPSVYPISLRPWRKAFTLSTA